ncbi:porin family protein [Imperialibacter roseus]|uniref:Porin family protein n=1 Tax=Imperialibacter roseus TaxID=1324217 RepID=A0ABZ0IJY7_9BACT|nr:porin family protein [Imperialibacter roseus]WOK04996.1 porin family protein [Imperialibacter roseus]
MKNTILATSLLMMFITSGALAQEAGLKGGLNFSNLYVNDVDDENMKIGFNAGVYYKAQLTDVLAIQPEILYSLKGAEVIYDNTFLGIGNGKYRFNLSYVDVPVALKISPVGNFYIEAGPYVSLLTSAKVKRIDSNGDKEVVDELDRDNFNTVDYGMFGGVGFNFTGGSLGVRYNYGLQEIGESGSNVAEATPNSKNSVLQIFMTLPF